MSNTGPLRGFAPFDEHDRSVFFGREPALQWIQDSLANSAALHLLIEGSSGTGKTSLARAGAAAMARQHGLVPVLFDLGDDWLEHLTEQLKRSGCITDLQAVEQSIENTIVQAAAQQPILLIVDRLSAIRWMAPAHRNLVEATLSHLLAAASANLRILLVAGDGDLDTLVALRRLGGSLNQAQRHRLEALSEGEVAKLIETLLLNSGAYSQGGIAQAIASDLCGDGPVPICEVQRVCHAASSYGALTEANYRRLGGAYALRAAYLPRLVASFDAEIVRQILLPFTLTDAGRELDELSLLSAAGLPPQQSAAVLEHLIASSIVAVTRGTSGRRYRLAHGQLAQDVRDFVSAERAARARAAIVVGRRRGRKLPLLPHDVLFLRRALAGDPAGLALLKFSQRFWLICIASLLGLAAISYGLKARSLANHIYVEAMPRAGDLPTLVWRRGKPSSRSIFPWFSGAGDLVWDSGLAATTVKPAVIDRDASKEAVAILMGALDPERAAVFARVAGIKTSEPAKSIAQRLAAAVLFNEPVALDLARQGLRSSNARDRLLASAVVVRQLVKPTLALVAEVLPSLDKAGVVHLPKLLEGIGVTKATALIFERAETATVHVRHAMTSWLERRVENNPKQLVKAILSARMPKDPQVRRLRRDLLKRSLAKVASSQERIALLATLVTPDLKASRVRELLQLVEASNYSSDLLSRLAAHNDFALRALGMRMQLMTAQTDSGLLDRLERLSRSRRPRKLAEYLRAEAARGIARLKGERSDRLKLLKRMLRDRSRVRRQAIRALLHLGTPGYAAVAKLLRLKRVDVAQHVIDALCKDVRPYRQFVRALAAGVWRIKRAGLKRRLLKCARPMIDASRGVTTWIGYNALREDDPSLRVEAAKAVAYAWAKTGRYGAVLRQYLRKSDEVVGALLMELAKQPARSLGRTSRRVVRLLKAGPKTRAALARLAGRASLTVEQRTVILSALLRDEKPSIRQVAADAALHLKANQLEDEARRTLDAGLTYALAHGAKPGERALELAREAALPGVLSHLSKHVDARWRRGVVEVVGQPKNYAQLPKLADRVLRGAAVDQDRRVRQAGIAMIARHYKAHQPETRTLLHRALDVGDAVDRAHAAQHVGRHVISDELRERVGQLCRSLNVQDQRIGVQIAAMWASKRPEWVRPWLTQAALSSVSGIRWPAIKGLAKVLAASQSVEQLAKTMRAHATNARIRLQALTALIIALRSGAKLPVAKDAHFLLNLEFKLAQRIADSQLAPEHVLAWLYHGDFDERSIARGGDGI